MKRHNHTLNFQNTTSGDMGVLLPVAAVDVLPGDSFIHKARLMARVAPLAFPVMHEVDVHLHHWFVPNRLVWDDWETFIVGNEGGVTYPTITPGSAAETVIYDRMGVEPVTGVAFDALPVRAYNLIWNEFYRDQDLSTARTIDKTDGADTTSDKDLARVAWGKDYFTTARATPQQGSALTIGFAAGTAPLTGIGIGSDTAAPWNSVTETDGTSYNDYGDPGGLRVSSTEADVETDTHLYFQTDGAGTPQLFADLTSASGGIDVNEMLQQVALQRIAEARSFFGSRYEDYLRFYGVNPRDGRLSRPEFLGGGRQRIAFSEVLATAEGTSTNVGDLFGHGIVGVRGKPYRKMFEEHGWMISTLFIRPKAMYQNGIPKRFLRTQPTDFWHKELEVLPWQEVNELEVYGGGSAANVFGYAPRYSEYREILSYVSGTFRGGTEEDWTLAREFASAPTLNESFITCTPSDRIYQDASMPEMLITIDNQIRARRLVSKHARIGNVSL